MMRFMDDLTNIYFSTRNSLRLTVENGLLSKMKIFLYRTLFCFVDGSCNGDSGLSSFRDNLAAVTKYSRCKPISTVNFVGENFAQASIVSRFVTPLSLSSSIELVFLVLNSIVITNILL